ANANASTVATDANDDSSDALQALQNEVAELKASAVTEKAAYDKLKHRATDMQTKLKTFMADRKKLKTELETYKVCHTHY
ncbi:hypothetical protein SARC_17396, partial [Sphaeroforma arctica JP610]